MHTMGTNVKNYYSYTLLNRVIISKNIANRAYTHTIRTSAIWTNFKQNETQV